MSDPVHSKPNTPAPDVAETGVTPNTLQGKVEADLAAARAKASELDERLNTLEDEALPKLSRPAPIGGMIGT